jgi:hypothetical protein
LNNNKVLNALSATTQTFEQSIYLQLEFGIRNNKPMLSFIKVNLLPQTSWLIPNSGYVRETLNPSENSGRDDGVKISRDQVSQGSAKLALPIGFAMCKASFAIPRGSTYSQR